MFPLTDVDQSTSPWEPSSQDPLRLNIGHFGAFRCEVTIRRTQMILEDVEEFD